MLGKEWENAALFYPPLPSLLRSLCVCVSVCAPEILGMPHWSSLADLLPQSLAKGFMLTAHGGTFNWNKSSASPERRKKPKKFANLLSCPTSATPISPLHTHWHTWSPRRRPRDISLRTKGIVNTWAFLQLIHSQPSAHFSWLFPFPLDSPLLAPPAPPSSVFQVEISTIPVQLMARMLLALPQLLRPLYQFGSIGLLVQLFSFFFVPRFLWVWVVCQIKRFELFTIKRKMVFPS